MSLLERKIAHYNVKKHLKNAFDASKHGEHAIAGLSYILASMSIDEGSKRYKGVRKLARKEYINSINADIKSAEDHIRKKDFPSAAKSLTSAQIILNNMESCGFNYVHLERFERLYDILRSKGYYVHDPFL